MKHIHIFTCIFIFTSFFCTAEAQEASRSEAVNHSCESSSNHFCSIECKQEGVVLYSRSKFFGTLSLTVLHNGYTVIEASSRDLARPEIQTLSAGASCRLY